MSLHRRAFLAFLLCIAGRAFAQGSRRPVIRYLNGFNRQQWAGPLASFHRGLAEGGFAEGRDVDVEYRWAEGNPERLPSLARELVRMRVAVIVATGGSTVALKASEVTRTVTTVFGIGNDPTRLGLAKTLNRPGGNFAGVYFLTSQLEGKRLGILRARAGRGSHRLSHQPDDRVGTGTSQGLRSRCGGGRPESAYDPCARRTADRRRVRVVRADACGRSAGRRRPHFLVHRNFVVAAAARYGIPAIYEQREFAAAGGLMSYGTSLNDASRQVGVYTARVLKGENAGDIPILQRPSSSS